MAARSLSGVWPSLAPPLPPVGGGGVLHAVAATYMTPSGRPLRRRGLKFIRLISTINRHRPQKFACICSWHDKAECPHWKTNSRIQDFCLSEWRRGFARSGPPLFATKPRMYTVILAPSFSASAERKSQHSFNTNASIDLQNQLLFLQPHNIMEKIAITMQKPFCAWARDSWNDKSEAALETPDCSTGGLVPDFAQSIETSH